MQTPHAHPSAGLTQLMNRMASGDRDAGDELLPLIYEQLRRIARGQLRRQRDQSLQSTGVVHELYLRLLAPDRQDRNSYASRAQFYGLVATAMHSLLVEHARRRAALKRGGAATPVSLGDGAAQREYDVVEFLALHDAIETLAAKNPQLGRIVELRFFACLTNEQCADLLGVSRSSIERGWRAARAWLKVELEDSRA